MLSHHRPVTFRPRHENIILSSSNNENDVPNASAIKPGSQTVKPTTTPAAASKSRRAFGDISNRRSTAPAKTPGLLVAKPTLGSTNINNNTSIKPPKAPLSSSLSSSKVFSSIVGPTPKLAPVVPLRPRTHHRHTTDEEESSIDDDSLFLDDDEPEVPLGRTYRQQWENGDHDEDYEDDDDLSDFQLPRSSAREWNTKVRQGYQEQRERDFQLRIQELDKEIEDFEALIVSPKYLDMSPDKDQLISLLDELDDELDKSVDDESDNSWNEFRRLDISFG